MTSTEVKHFRKSLKKMDKWERKSSSSFFKLRDWNGESSTTMIKMEDGVSKIFWVKEDGTITGESKTLLIGRSRRGKLTEDSDDLDSPLLWDWGWKLNLKLDKVDSKLPHLGGFIPRKDTFMTPESLMWMEIVNISMKNGWLTYTEVRLGPNELEKYYFAIIDYKQTTPGTEEDKPLIKEIVDTVSSCEVNNLPDSLSIVYPDAEEKK